MWQPIPLPVTCDFICQRRGEEGDADYYLDPEGCCPRCGSYDDVEEIPYY